jgi:hypothetical protein
MPFRFVHPDLTPIERFDPEVHPVLAVTSDALLEGGIDAWVRLEGWEKGDAQTDASVGRGLPAIRFARFRVPIRVLLPGPTLGPRDPDVMAWIERHGWKKAVESAEQSWLKKRQPEAYAEVKRLRAEKHRQAAAEKARRRNEDEARPGLLDELVDQAGQVIDDTKKAITDAAETLGTVIKWSAFGAVGIGAGLLAVRAVEAARQR